MRMLGHISGVIMTILKHVKLQSGNTVIIDGITVTGDDEISNHICEIANAKEDISVLIDAQGNGLYKEIGKVLYGLTRIGFDPNKISIKLSEGLPIPITELKRGEV